ncbi:SLBB domain-containing protein [Rikenella microfusus]|uniref:Polysialic acid transport protein kpsD n=2 Tax=Rikenella microfusus TaxID=28139 RepID=A0A379MQH6_9BACT|nr:SLBB domain-containing protein [Rikenella microfusus]SUE33009.1 Polysialic acid transport protein kpsD precursor [Rikenella microfusus]
MTFKLFTASAFAIGLLAFSTTDLSAQTQNIDISKEELIRQAMSKGYDPSMRQGLEGLDIEGLKNNGTSTSTGKSGSGKSQTTSTTTDRTRKDSDLKNLEYDRRNNGVDTKSSAYQREQDRQSDYRKRTVRDKDGNLVDAETGEIFETADGTVTALGQQNRISAVGTTVTDPRLNAVGELTPAEANRLKEEEKRIQDSILRNSVFGREIFSARNLTFAPTYNLPTPANYVLAAGDRLFIDLWGDAEANYDLKVSPDGFITVPNAGIINVGGLTVEAAENRIRNKMASTVAGLGDGTVDLKLSLGDIRSIKVNIIGEASMPGTYTLPSLATLFNALYEAGGVSDIGSLRSIKLIRGGKQVADLDVYDYLVGGRQEVNVGLQDNDMIIVQPYENLVKVTGKVKRPRIYELRKGETADDLLKYAGGFMGEAYKDNLTVNRKSGRMMSVHSVPVEEFAEFAMADGDSIAVGEVIRQYANRVTVEGAVWRPGDYELSDSMSTLKALIRKAEGIRGDALMSRTQIVRLNDDYTFSVESVDLRGLLNGTVADVALKPEDLVRIPSVNSLREGYTIEVKGEVNTPQTLLYRDNMTIEDAILMANGLKESASLARIEVARRVKNPNSTEPSDRIAELFQFNIPADLGLSPETASFTLQPFDEVYIRRSPGYSEQNSVFAQGEFLFDGEYVLSTNNDRLSDLVAKAGGLTPEAYLKGAYLKRQLSEEQLTRQETLADLSERNKAAAKDSIMIKKKEVGDYYPIAIDLTAALNDPSCEENLILEDGDMLVVPKFNNTVTISGAVLYPCTVTYVKGMKIKDYIARGGGYSARAKKRPFVIYANGLPDAKKGGRWPKIAPGCEIVVPSKPPKGSGMGATEIMSLANSSISMAAMITSLFR